MKLSHKICFRIVLYITTAYTLTLGQHFFEALTSQGGGIFLFILWPFIIPPLSITPWYLIRFQKNQVCASIIASTTYSYPVLVSDKRPVYQKTQTITPSDDIKLWKSDHAVALIWTGIMGILSLLFIYLIIGNLAMIIFFSVNTELRLLPFNLLGAEARVG